MDQFERDEFGMITHKEYLKLRKQYAKAGERKKRKIEQLLRSMCKPAVEQQQQQQQQQQQAVVDVNVAASAPSVVVEGYDSPDLGTEYDPNADAYLTDYQLEDDLQAEQIAANMQQYVPLESPPDEPTQSTMPRLNYQALWGQFGKEPLTRYLASMALHEEAKGRNSLFVQL
ncbi:hypothetical protein BDF20DRAFT_1005199 [Mycotypha africana]|uniref:uncharacterized protein n=1 Tax=Mycotypha africana TaxID=64632 RepID=UPI0023009D7F|nr:uncharacterized protein BDF20DRAFT_1005199 [Mycotypha africana]KAI8966965.1 hypothetical protein BDF20DRAFT_1005199 [Mycotypha africana]